MNYPEPVQKLIDAFAEFPGIGPRQAARFVFLLLKNRKMLEEISVSLKKLEKTGLCSQCFCVIEDAEKILCRRCADSGRDKRLIAVVEKEADMQNMEKTGVYRGLYHVLGENLSPLDPDSPKKLHLKNLYERVRKILGETKKCEIVFATGATTEGDTTALYLERILSPLKNEFPEFKISRLGRGLSLGSELEYADEITIKNALANRK